MTGIEIALALIKNFEGCKLQAYQLEGETWLTIGYGHALPLNDRNKTITQQEAEDLLETDLSSRDTDLRDQLGIVYAKLTPGQLGATLSFKFNCKPILFDNSTFLVQLKLGNFARAQDEFKRWVYGEGHVQLPGLVRRRKCEGFVFGGGTIADLDKNNWFFVPGTDATMPAYRYQETWQNPLLPPDNAATNISPADGQNA